MSSITFNHTTFNNLESGIVRAFLDEFWEFLSAKINASPLFDDFDKKELFKNSDLIIKFKEEYINYQLFTVCTGL